MSWQFWRRRTTVVIRYRNGDVVRTRCRAFKVVTQTSAVTGERAGMRIEWNGLKPAPLLLGVDDIQSIWEE